MQARRELMYLGAGLLALGSTTLAYREWLHITNSTTVSLTFLMVVLLVAARATLRTALVTSIVAMLLLNYFFLPPVGTFVIADLHNWIALFAFLTVSLVASNLSAMARAAEASRRGEELKSALLASLAHDLRTPLTAMRVAASNLQSSSLGDDDRRNQSEVILTEVGRLTRLFQNILEMARIDAGALATETRWVHPSEIIAAAREHVGQATQHHTLDVRVDPDIPLELDPRPVAAAISQVLENAAQYTPAGSAIQLNASVTTEGLVVRVRDHGPGVAAGDLPRLFDRFYRGTAARPRSAGTGMGLSIARGLLASVGGRIWAENHLEGGALFTIVVPAGKRIEPADAEDPV